MKTITKLAIFNLLVLSSYSNAQTVSDFENLTLPADSFWNGIDLTQGFISGNALFTNYYDTADDYWSKGFAYSNMKDDTTAGYTNTYSSITATGYNNSTNYAIGKEGAIIKLNNPGKGGLVTGMYITNSTYAALSMRDGDAFARQFGDTTGTNSGLAQGDFPDWFKISITGFYNGNSVEDTVHFYLADYRFENNSEDYIVSSWEWVDLTNLGNLDSLIFHLASSDVGDWGMNTPGFFCLDGFTTGDSPLLVHESIFSKNLMDVYPNPAIDFINISWKEDSEPGIISIMDLSGRLILKKSILQEKKYCIPVSNYPNGVYIVETSFADQTSVRKIIIKK